MDVADLTADLIAEQEALDEVVAPLEPDQWATPTPSEGWAVADQIGHLSYFDRAAVIAIEDPERFGELRDALFTAAFGKPGALDELTLGPARAMTADELLDEWREGRRLLVDAAAALRDGVRVPWYGPDMSPKSFLTARLMETWAHGQDVVDAVEGSRPPTDRLVHVAQLGVITRGWSYANRQMDAPDTAVRVELVAPGGVVHEWGPDDATESITGPMLDFCLVVTQRRHVDDTALSVVGDAARDWMTKAQAFAGGATDGPSPGAG